MTRGKATLPDTITALRAFVDGLEPGAAVLSDGQCGRPLRPRPPHRT
jgi:hypothetical protein